MNASEPSVAAATEVDGSMGLEEAMAHQGFTLRDRAPPAAGTGFSAPHPSSSSHPGFTTTPHTPTQDATRPPESLTLSSSSVLSHSPDSASSLSSSESDSDGGEFKQREDHFFRTHVRENVFVTSSAASGDSLESLLVQLGGRSLGDTFVAGRRRCLASGKDDGKWEARRKLVTAALTRALANSRLEEGETCWLEGVADEADLTRTIPPNMWFKDAEAILADAEGIKFGRKPDASLRSANASVPSWANILVPVHNTTSTLPPLLTNPQILYRRPCAKLRKGITTAIDVLCGPQQTRLFVLGLAFFGREGKPMDAVFFAADREVVRLHLILSIADENFATLAALLATLRGANLYQLGFSPHFSYSIYPQPPFPKPAGSTSPLSHHNDVPAATRTKPRLHLPGDIIPTTFYLPDPHFFTSPSSYGTPPFKASSLIIGDHLSYFPESPFSRCTLVFRAVHVRESGNHDSVVVKIQWVRNGRAWREAEILAHLWKTALIDTSVAKDVLSAINEDVGPPPGDSPTSPSSNSTNYPATGPPSYAPTLLAAFASDKLSYQSPLAPQPRHLEILITSTPLDAIPLQDVTEGELISSMMDAIDALEHAHSRGVTHGDLATGNLFSSKGRILLLDWELGQYRKEGGGKSSQERMGTRDTMATGQLEGNPATPADDVEALLMCFLKIATRRIVPSPERKATWDSKVDQLFWERAALTVPDEILVAVRQAMWGNGNAIANIIDLLVDSHRPLAELLFDVARLNVPLWTDGGIDRTTLRRLRSDGMVSLEQWETLRKVFQDAKEFLWKFLK